jgi:uncharacterized protein YvpB
MGRLGLVVGAIVLLIAMPIAAFAQADDEVPDAWVLPENPAARAWVQQSALSCEVAAVKQALFFWDTDPTEHELMELLGYDPDPDIGFRGRLNANQTLDDYGAHAPAIARVIESYRTERFDFRATALESLDDIRAALRRNHPVIAWIPVGLRASVGVPVVVAPDVVRTLVYAEHAVVIYGYDADGFFIYDPGRSARISYASNVALERSISYFEHRALEVAAIDRLTEGA